MLSSDKRFARAEGIPWRLIEDEAILIDRLEGEMLRLNGLGALIWQGLDGTRTLEEVIDSLHHTFDVKRNVLQKDVTRFLKLLLRHEMVEEV